MDIAVERRRLPTGHRQTLLSERDARPRDGPPQARIRRHQLHRVQLRTAAVQRLPRTPAPVRLRPADGGSDQWGNIVGGVDLIRRVDGESAHAITVPLVTSSDGKKFGKSTGGGSLWLDPELTSPYVWYQYFVNTADADVVRYLRWFTFLDREEIDELERATAETPHLRLAQKKLAAEMTTLIHGAEHTAAVELASQALFGRAELTDLDEGTLSAAVGETKVAEFAGERPTIVELLVATGLSDSNKAARRAVDEGGAYVNNTKITDAQWTPSDGDLLHGRWLVVRRGKKSFAGARFSS